MTSQPILINPNGQILPEIASRMFRARKTKDVWARVLTEPTSVETIEGVKQAGPGDMLCRGIKGEYWPQKAEKFLDKYVSTGERDKEEFERFRPKPGAAPIEAAKVTQAFRVVAQWGELTGQAGDYVARSTSDPKDVWIVAREIFEATYEVAD